MFKTQPLLLIQKMRALKNFRHHCVQQPKLRSEETEVQGN